MKCIFICPEDTAGRADKILSDHYPEFSRAFIKKSIKSGQISRLDGTQIEPKAKIGPGDRLVVSLVRPKPFPLKPYAHKLSVLHEDEQIIVINKEAGMVVHPGDGTNDQTLVHALLHHCPGNLSPVGSPFRPGIVHRLDKETSGVMVVAKSEAAHLCLVEQFANRKTRKLYQAIVCGKTVEGGDFKQPIGRHPTVRIKMAVSEKGKTAHTQWKTIEHLKDKLSLVECAILTGRTHQIRVHFSAAGHPLAGDTTYGYKSANPKKVVLFPRVMLHACKLGFVHPLSREELEFIAPLPEDFKQCLKELTL